MYLRLCSSSYQVDPRARLPDVWFLHSLSGCISGSPPGSSRCGWRLSTVFQFLRFLAYLFTLQRGWVLLLAWMPWALNVILSTNLPICRMTNCTDSLIFSIIALLIGGVPKVKWCSLGLLFEVVWPGCASCLLHACYMLGLLRGVFICGVQVLMPCLIILGHLAPHANRQPTVMPPCEKA